MARRGYLRPGGVPLVQLQPHTEQDTRECAQVITNSSKHITKLGILGIPEIHGTDGQQFHPLIKDSEDDIWLFTPDLCR